MSGGSGGFRRGLIWSVLAILAAAWLAFLAPGSGSDPQAESLWTHDAPAAFSQAKASKQAMVIDFYADWCGPCQDMEKTTLRDRKVMAKLENLVALKVNVDQKRELAQRYGVEFLPTTIIADSQGKPIATRTGYLDAAAYLALLDKAPAPPTPRTMPSPSVADPRD